jgi:hypothetical protein
MISPWPGQAAITLDLCSKESAVFDQARKKSANARELMP